MPASMTALLRILRRPAIRLTAQAGVSVLLVALLVWLARQGNIVEALTAIRPGDLALAGLLYLSCTLLAVRRWQLLLRCRGVDEPWHRLAGYYFFSLFYSTFLPTSVAGDAIRIYEVNRRGHSLGRVVAVTFQDRVLGLGSTMLLGLATTLWFLSLLPASLAGAFLLLQLAGLLAVVAFLYPGLLLACVRRVWRSQLLAGFRHRTGVGGWSDRVRFVLRKFEDLPPLRWRNAVLLQALGLAGILLAVGAHVVLARSLGIEAGFVEFCLVVPLVWIVKLLPVSLNGLGVGEGAFVWLLGLFAVSPHQALAVALAMLGLQTALSLIGGGLLLGRMLMPTLRRPAQPEPEQEMRRVA